MPLSNSDVAVLVRLQGALTHYVNQQLRVVPEKERSPDPFTSYVGIEHVKLRDALATRLDLIQRFCNENPARLSDEEVGIVRLWEHRVQGSFLIYKELKKYAVFLSKGPPAIAYGVLEQSQRFSEIIGPYWPAHVTTVLLPFKGSIVYDGVLQVTKVTFGAGIRRTIDEAFKAAKDRYGIVESLPMSNEPLRPKPSKPKAPPKALPFVGPDVLQPIVELIEQFCNQHLTKEYADVCRKMAEKLARKRLSPLLSGSSRVWACGIVRTVGWVNFLYDESQTPHMRLSDIDPFFGVSASAGSGKQAAIRQILKIRQLDPQWMLPGQEERIPYRLKVKIHGLFGLR